MAGILSGKHAGFLSEEIFSEDMNIEAVDGDLLAEELEQAQEQLFAEQEKFNIAIEAECETEETKQEIMEALESDINDVVYAKLLVNKLSKNNTVFYGDSKPLTSGLESDRNSDAKIILTAGLEDAKGMLGSIKEFIAKVWQKIKDAFAWVWKKMKDFWAWLTGASKKAEEKKEETVVAAAGVNAATAKSKEIIAIAQTTSYKAGSGSEVNSKRAASEVNSKRAAEAVKKYKERMDKAASSSKAKGESGLTVKGGKFDGRDLGSLSFSEMSEMLEEGNVANTETVNDVVIADIITEEVAKTTGLSEEKVASYISPAMMKIMSVFAFDPSLAAKISVIVKKNLDTNAEKITKDMTLPIVLSLGKDYGVFGKFEYKPSEPFDWYKNYASPGAKIETIKSSISKALSATVKQNRSLTDSLFDFIDRNNMSDWERAVSLSVTNAIELINNTASTLDTTSFKTLLARGGMEKADTVYLKTYFAAVTPISVSGNTVTYINAFEKGTIELENVALISSDRLSGNFIKAISETQIGKAMGRNEYKGIRGGDIADVQSRLEHLIKFADQAIARVEKAGETYLDGNDSGKLKDNAEWKKIQSSFIKLVSNVSFYNPVLIINAGKSGLTALESVVNTIDIKGAIAQASKEFDSSKFKFDKK